MKKEFVDIIKEDNSYKELVSKRGRFSIKLTLIMLFVYFSFILTIAFKPSILSTPISSSSVITVGIPLGVFVIVLAFVLTGIYTYKANGEFDELSRKIDENLIKSINDA